MSCQEVNSHSSVFSFVCFQQNTQALLLHKQGNWWLAMGISRGWVWWGYGCRRTLRRDNWGDFSSPSGSSSSSSNSNKPTGECPSLELSRWHCVPHHYNAIKGALSWSLSKFKQGVEFHWHYTFLRVILGYREGISCQPIRSTTQICEVRR